MAYDKADWHTGATDFPPATPPENGAKHFGWFYRWSLENNLVSEFDLKEFPEGIEALRQGKITGAGFVLKYLDGLFTREDLNDAGNNFASGYYDKYMGEYEKVFKPLAKGNTYTVPDKEEYYKLVKNILDNMYTEWLKTHPKK